jgi:hypothetical protein
MTEKEFNALSRPELNAIATERGLEAESYNNRDAVRAAILEDGYELAPEEETPQAPATETKKASKSSTPAEQQPGHPVRFDESGNPVYK